LCWVVAVASVLLQNLYVRPTLDYVGVALVLLASFFAGIVIMDLKEVVLGWVAFLILLLVIAFSVLSLPLLLRRVPHPDLLSQQFYSGIFVVMLRATFPFLLLETLLASLLGAMFGARVLDYARIEKIKVFSFVVIAVIAVAALWTPTNNYTYFYEAMEKVDMTASRGLMTFNQSDHVVVIPINATFHNPTGYDGIAIVTAIYWLYYVGKNGSAVKLCMDRLRVKDSYLAESGSPISVGGEPVPPYSSVSRSFDLTINLEKETQTFDEMRTLQETGQNVTLIMGNSSLDVCVAAAALVFVGRTIIPIEDVPLTYS